MTMTRVLLTDVNKEKNIAKIEKNKKTTYMLLNLE